MRVLFYSESCNFCLKLLEYIDKNKLGQYFKLISIDKSKNIPGNVTVVPTIIDTTIEAPLEGKKAFEYVINQKYFNHPTNNVEYTKDGVPKPSIEEDAKANASKSGAGFIYVDEAIEKRFNDKENKQGFDQVFTYRNAPSASNAVHQTYNNNSSNNPNPHHQNQHYLRPGTAPMRQQNPQQTIQHPPQSDERVNQLLAQRSIQDKKMQALMRLRGSN